MNLDALFDTLRQLRDPETGCPWDREATLEALTRPVLSEADELAHALESGNADDMAEEAGDLLWNVCFVIHVGEEMGLWRKDEVAGKVVEKMIRRHPHVFGGETVHTVEEAREAYQNAKAREKTE